jgi:glycosyltransferase involved in cell wall biosynthesis
MKILVWQWGRRGAGPRFAACLADALRFRPGIEVTLSLCRDAEILGAPNPPPCEMPVHTYSGMASFLLRLVTVPFALPFLLLRLSRIMPDLAICAMPGPLDPLMAMALRLMGTRIVVVVHDAESHPGDGFPGQMLLQRLLCHMAHGLAVLCDHVGTVLRRRSLTSTLIPFEHPPFAFDLPTTSRADGPPRLLCFGRLLPYKGLDLLAEALAQHHGVIEVRVVGSGPETPALDALRACPGVTVENRWVPETEIGSLLAWSDALILPYREASQSGVAAAAIAAGRPVIATRVGGLGEQLSATPHAILCSPDAASLAHAITQWGDSPCPPAPSIDGAVAWRDAASRLLVAIGMALPSQQPPKPLHGTLGPPARGKAPLMSRSLAQGLHWHIARYRLNG